MKPLRKRKGVPRSCKQGQHSYYNYHCVGCGIASPFLRIGVGRKKYVRVQPGREERDAE